MTKLIKILLYDAVSIVLIDIFAVTLGVYYSGYRFYAAPFYVYFIARAVEFVIPSVKKYIK